MAEDVYVCPKCGNRLKAKKRADGTAPTCSECGSKMEWGGW